MSAEVERVLELPVVLQESESRSTVNLEDRIGPGTTDYKQLNNLPRINGNPVLGSHDGSYYGLVNAVQGKGLSDQNFTLGEKQKLNALPAITELNQALSQKVNAVAGKALSSNDYTNADKQKLQNTTSKNAMMILLEALKSKRTISNAVYDQIVDLL